MTVGLTGGIASGKSAVDHEFEMLGAAVLDADAIVHELLASDPNTIGEITKAFGSEVVSASGVNRTALGRLVFADASALRRLEKIVHPRVSARLRARIEELGRSAAPPAIIIIDAALMVETGSYRDYDKLVVVTASEEIRRNRLMARDGLDRAAADLRIAAQASDEKKLAAADYRIHNDGPIEALREQVRDLHGLLMADWRRLNGPGA